jgi:small subunit ribosomal protein S18
MDNETSTTTAATASSTTSSSTTTTTTGETEDDFFGKAFDDGPDKLGPTLPPQYIRDATTGRLTGDVVESLSHDDNDDDDATTSSLHDRRTSNQLSAKQIQLLRASDVELQQRLNDKVQNYWTKLQDTETTKEGTTTTPLAAALGERIRKVQRDLSILGRLPAAQQLAAQSSDVPAKDPQELTVQRLTPDEVREFRAYMKKHHKVEIDVNDVPVLEDTNTTMTGKQRMDPTMKSVTEDWAIQWRTEQAQRQMDDLVSDNPYADIMPQDLSTTKLVNRNQAHRLPTELLHHNNTSFLQAFITQTGSIKDRVRTRLGARDQRKIAKLIKQARALGIIPYNHPFRIEEHGWVWDPTLPRKQDNDDDDHAADKVLRPWEKEMQRRGLTLKRKPKKDPTQYSWRDFDREGEDDEVGGGASSTSTTSTLLY